MAHFQQYTMHGVRYVHCGDDFWRLMDKNGYVHQHARRFTCQEGIESWIENQHKEMECGE